MKRSEKDGQKLLSGPKAIAAAKSARAKGEITRMRVNWLEGKEPLRERLLASWKAKNPQAWADERDSHGRTFLHWAAEALNPKAVADAFEGGANPAALDESSGSSALHLLVRWNSQKGTDAQEQEECLRLTLAHPKTDVNARDHAQKAPLHRAAAGGCSLGVRMLLEAGASAKAKDWFGSDASNYAELAMQGRTIETLQAAQECLGLLQSALETKKLRAAIDRAAKEKILRADASAAPAQEKKPRPRI